MSNSHLEFRHFLKNIPKFNSDIEKVKKFLLVEFLGFIISAKKCVILDMSKAMGKCENQSIFSKLHIGNLFY